MQTKIFPKDFFQQGKDRNSLTTLLFHKYQQHLVTIFISFVVALAVRKISVGSTEV